VYPGAPHLSKPSDGDTLWSRPTITLIWNPVNTADQYEFQVATDMSFRNPIDGDSTAGTSHEVSGLSDAKYYWRVRARNECGWGGWSDIESFVKATRPEPSVYISPNPFVGIDRVSIIYSVPPGDVTLRVFDTAGNLVKTLLNSEPNGGGKSTKIWDGRNRQGQLVANGVYFIEITTDAGVVLVGKMAVVQ
jgi:hypothetical protein